MARAVIFINGQIPDYNLVKSLIKANDIFIAVDGGSKHALKLGLKLSIVIGDLDSLSALDRKKLEKDGTDIQAYPRYKNETDFELALLYTQSAGYKEILAVGALGNRLDQTIGNIGLLSSPILRESDIQIDDGMEQVYFVRRRADIKGEPGDIISLIPWGGKVNGIITVGLRWSLNGDTLLPFQTRGISNELISQPASISIKSGLLLVIKNRQR